MDAFGFYELDIVVQAWWIAWRDCHGMKRVGRKNDGARQTNICQTYV